MKYGEGSGSKAPVVLVIAGIVVGEEQMSPELVQLVSGSCKNHKALTDPLGPVFANARSLLWQAWERGHKEVDRMVAYAKEHINQIFDACKAAYDGMTVKALLDYMKLLVTQKILEFA